MEFFKKRGNEKLIYLGLTAIFSLILLGVAHKSAPPFINPTKILLVISSALLIKIIFDEHIRKNIYDNPTYCLLAGVLFSIVAFITSYFLFRPFIGLSTILFIVILAMPSLSFLTDRESCSIKSQKISFWEKHRHTVNFYVYFFIGTFIVFFLIGLVAHGMVFSLEDLKDKSSAAEQPKALEISEDVQPQFQIIFEQPKIDLVNSIFTNNFYVMFIAWILSLFYGAGSLFLITFNASIFASALVHVIKMKIPHLGLLFTYSFLACNMGTMFIHMIPEVLAYFIAAMSGSLLAAAFIDDEFMSTSFKKVIKDSFILLVIAGVVLYIAALLEVFASKSLFTANVCRQPMNSVNIGLIVLVMCIFIFEFLRRKNFYRKAN